MSDRDLLREFVQSTTASATSGSMTARAQKMPAASEDELLQAIVEAALFLGWRVHHDRRSDKALQQGSPGFPDLVLARRGRLLFVELKSDRGQMTEGQGGWLMAIPAADYRLWRPADLDAALAELSKP